MSIALDRQCGIAAQPRSPASSAESADNDRRNTESAESDSAEPPPERGSELRGPAASRSCWKTAPCGGASIIMRSFAAEVPPAELASRELGAVDARLTICSIRAT
eukprot:1053532-Pleurochrysis_carterae.AAC.2